MDSQDRRHVAAPITVVGRGPHSCERTVEHVFVAFLNQLMRPRNQSQAVNVIKLDTLVKNRCKTDGLLTSLVTVPPKSQPAPRGLTAHLSTSSGSDHMRSTPRQNMNI